MITEIGSPGWTKEEIQDGFEEFAALYPHKPVPDNEGGMKAPHAFATYFMMKRLQPLTVIESGVWKGQGTWLIEQACPDAQIISLDIDLSRLIYRSPKVEYIERDFSYLNVRDLDRERTLCFFDDHQNALIRLQQMKWKGLRKAIFEDNYPVPRGDCYSLKKIFANAGFWLKGNGLKFKVKRGLQHFVGSNSNGHVLANSTHSAELTDLLSLYYEFPPLFKEPNTRWGDPWDAPSYPTKPPVFDDSFEHPLRAEALHYNWMCLIELKS